MHQNTNPAAEAVIEIEDLTIAYETRKGDVKAVKDVSFCVQEGETVRRSDSEAGGYRFHLVPSGTCLGRDAPEVG